jgi:hypothetical protein
MRRLKDGFLQQPHVAWQGWKRSNSSTNSPSSLAPVMFTPGRVAGNGSTRSARFDPSTNSRSVPDRIWHTGQILSKGNQGDYVEVAR